MPNIGQVIKNHNKSILDQNETELPKKRCNCREKTACPLQNKCLTECVIYRAQVTSGIETSTYIGLTECTVIPRYNAPRYNADLAITRFFVAKVFLPHLLI